VSLAIVARVPAASPPLETRLRDLVRDIARGAWFAACGEPLTEDERGDAAAYRAALGFTQEIATVADWPTAAAVTQRADWSQEWWKAESAAEARLKAAAANEFGEDRLLAALTHITEAAAALAGAAAQSMARSGIADPALMRVAAGSAAQACHQAALARAVDAGSAHPFAIKYRLFAAGRWPLGIIGTQFFLF
jgi:hypothetical protein